MKRLNRWAGGEMITKDRLVSSGVSNFQEAERSTFREWGLCQPWELQRPSTDCASVTPAPSTVPKRNSPGVSRSSPAGKHGTKNFMWSWWQSKAGSNLFRSLHTHHRLCCSPAQAGAKQLQLTWKNQELEKNLRILSKCRVSTKG